MGIINPLLSFAIAAVFLLSGITKLLDHSGSAHTLREFGLRATWARQAMLRMGSILLWS